MSETRTTLTTTWQSVYTAPLAGANLLTIGDPALAGDICWTTDATLSGTATTGGVPLCGVTSWDKNCLPGATLYARSPSGAVVTVVVV